MDMSSSGGRYVIRKGTLVDDAGEVLGYDFLPFNPGNVGRIFLQGAALGGADVDDEGAVFCCCWHVVGRGASSPGVRGGGKTSDVMTMVMPFLRPINVVHRA